MKISIYGTSDIINHHIRSAIENSFKIFSICSSNKNSKNILNLSKKFKIKKIFYDYKKFVKNSYLNNCCVLIAGRIKDNKKILNECLKYNLKVIIEKPVLLKEKEFNKYLKFNENIFVGYNRIYYNCINELKLLVRKEAPHSIIINCPETNKKNIILNSCHLISIIYHMFGDLKFLYKIKNKKNITCIFKSKKNIPIIININFELPDNFGIELNFKNKRAKLSPIETLKIYDKIIKKKYKKNNFYFPVCSKEVNEYNLTKFKPGFNLQYLNFKRFLKNKKNISINIRDSKKIISICERIIS